MLLRTQSFICGQRLQKAQFSGGKGITCFFMCLPNEPEDFLALPPSHMSPAKLAREEAASSFVCLRPPFKELQRMLLRTQSFICGQRLQKAQFSEGKGIT